MKVETISVTVAEQEAKKLLYSLGDRIAEMQLETTH